MELLGLYSLTTHNVLIFNAHKLDHIHKAEEQS